MFALATEVVGSGLTVREVERRVRNASSGSATRRRPKLAVVSSQPAEARAIEEQLRRRFQTDAHVVTSGAGKGDVRLSFYSVDDLERLLDLLLGPSREAL
jgi:ParB family chromosome partitioning protein